MEKSLLSRIQGNILLFGIVSTIFGLIALIWPEMTAVTFVTIWGIFALTDGITALYLAFTSKAYRGQLIVKGILGIIAGIIVILSPGTGITAAAWTLGFWLTFRGVIEAMEAWTLPTLGYKLLGFLRALLWILAAAIVMAHPGSAAIGFSLWLGAFVLVSGLSSIATYFALRRVRRNLSRANGTSY
ncbi:DUF308 domain-containing protein [Arcanobacterium haemolyticum]|nr:DUF308 domain-containing protein [Arcanobacterium haemolyticum]